MEEASRIHSSEGHRLGRKFQTLNKVSAFLFYPAELLSIRNFSGLTRQMLFGSLKTTEGAGAGEAAEDPGLLPSIHLEAHKHL